MKETSERFRRRAVSAEQTARSAPTPAIRKEWEQIAIEWHALASLEVVSQETSDILEIETT
ncbi:MAG: hypothetical protein ACLP1D_16620 [Xanthobacteraceae bacterium]